MVRRRGQLPTPNQQVFQLPTPLETRILSTGLFVVMRSLRRRVDPSKLRPRTSVALFRTRGYQAVQVQMPGHKGGSLWRRKSLSTANCCIAIEERLQMKWWVGTAPGAGADLGTS
ncbi:hypothetical protein J1614_007413 [Plenodomus biglobosus]|nr:hypothetical protein J1614_007413 [Plenodomus biglobosus]